MAASRERSRRRRRRLLAATLALAAGALLCELALRWLLFWGTPLRDASLYVPNDLGDDYHLLRARLDPPAPGRGPGLPHRELGWVGRAVDPATLRHADEERLAGRRPVLLFGSSYAACWHAPAVCFPSLLDRSPLGRELALLNYGAPGYGPDQSLLLATRVAERLAASDPIVVLSLVLELDLSRSTLAFFHAPKPRFVRDGDGHRLEPPDGIDPAAYLERHPPEITSYAWRYLLYGANLVPKLLDPRPALAEQHFAERHALADFCLAEFHARMEALGLQHFVLLFHTPNVLELPDGIARGERLLLAALAGRGIPFVDARREVEAERAATGTPLELLYQNSHPTERGTAVLFEALVRGLEPLAREPRREGSGRQARAGSSPWPASQR